MRLVTSLKTILFGGLLLVGVPVFAGDSGDPRDYQRDVERKLQRLERRDYERHRDLERRLRNDDMSPREFYRMHDRLERERRDDLRDYERWREDRDRDFYRAQDRRYDREFTRYYEATPWVETGHYSPGGGFGIQTRNFSFYVGP